MPLVMPGQGVETFAEACAGDEADVGCAAVLARADDLVDGSGLRSCRAM